MKAIILNLCAWSILPIMDAFAKYLSQDMHVLQVVWARYFFTVVIVLPIILIFFKKQFKWTDKPQLQLIRGLLLLFATLFFFYSLSKISMAKALTLAFVCPLVVTAFSPFLLNERVGFRRWSAVIIGFLGSLIVIRPGFIDFNLASIAALGTGIMYAFYLIATRKLSTSDSPLLTLLLTGIIGALLTTVIIPFVWVFPSKEQWLMMFSIGLFATLGHLFLILSLRLADASKLAPLAYFEIVNNVIIGFYIFNEFPDNWTLLGLFIIILSGVYISRREVIVKSFKNK